MKTKMIKSVFLTALAVLMVSFNANAGDKKPINTEKSTVIWLAKKVTGEHNGTINFKSGDVQLEDGKLVGGTFVVDMTTIDITDLEGSGKAKLKGHLNSKDFFGVEEHPEATFLITSVVGNVVKGDLTIKGHTEKESYTLEVNGNTISGVVKVDRTKFGIHYGSNSFFDNLKDKAIDDEFELTINIVF